MFSFIVIGFLSFSAISMLQDMSKTRWLCSFFLFFPFLPFFVRWYFKARRIKHIEVTVIYLSFLFCHTWLQLTNSTDHQLCFSWSFGVTSGIIITTPSVHPPTLACPFLFSWFLSQVHTMHLASGFRFSVFLVYFFYLFIYLFFFFVFFLSVVPSVTIFQ